MSIGSCCGTFEIRWKYKNLYGKKLIVSVTYENERISIKKHTLLKMCYVSPVWSTGQFMAVLWVVR